ncbi:helix-hairpin-helix domain-containing protein [Aggregatibacter actinomycetemcomitans]|nr:helix-hairpin-helix domain-containing protein [Aggregatibacter actinomycetemcomitans]MBN6067514.1 helix-hairpin-helix domain-containing protein [Aggregatibacter actinomycetemcomitans]MBN6086554.1 helix-hairpin-helix domain-containing protein [Aggregatibacter actinomycetemcomitans]MCE3056749.1 helix-hairpin-helix domain-containing protein [Aggregatibacter actinomycetemcomitans]QEH46932.1 helix-hairpin-helix domain-containing protein [Aggregatibacter actinomycetemcomitans]TYA30962.1 helix-hai
MKFCSNENIYCIFCYLKVRCFFTVFFHSSEKEEKMKSLKSLLAVAVVMTVSTTVFAEESVFTEVKDGAKSAWQTVKSDAKTVGGKVKEGAVKVKDATKEKFVEAKEATKETFTKAKDATKEKFAEGKKAVKDTFQNEKPAPVEDKSTAKEKSAVENKAKITRSKKVDINTADAATLENLSGIGEAKAKAIVEYREKNGKFKNLNDLSNVPGIGDVTLEKVKSHVRFN